MKNDINIAGTRSIQDWNDLKAQLLVDKNDHWDRAFKFFEERITTRYLNPIHRILEMDLNTGEGFAVVNLQCSLIETIECFYNGWIWSHPNFIDRNGGKKTFKNNFVFSSFLEKRSPFNKLINGDLFYYNVRCALLYETQTKQGWLIKKEDIEGGRFYEEKDNTKILYRSNFQKAIEEVILNYKREIVEENNIELRENFKSKFQHICDVSKANP